MQENTLQPDPSPPLHPSTPYKTSTRRLSHTPLTRCRPLQDPYDKARPPLIKLLKTDSANWVSQYARGGSARKLSARTFYNAVDAVSGHIASNG
jgi:hypothetical protein